MNIPYIILIVQVVVLSLFWYLIAIRKIPISGPVEMKTGLPDNELLISLNNKITNSKIFLDDKGEGNNTLWTAERILMEIKNMPKPTPIPVPVGLTVAEVTNLIKQNAQPKVYFDVSRNNSLKTAGVITYAAILTQSSNSGIDIATGVFTAPLAGLYRITFTGLRYYFVEAPTPTRIAMKKNGIQVAVTASTSEVKAIDLSPKPPGGECLSMNILTSLNKGDRVLCEIEVGGIYDTVDHHVTHFTGELMIEK